MALVAKSYHGLKQIGEIYIANGRQYIKVELKDGTTKSVRAYTEKEYKKFYPDAVIDKTADPYYKSQKEVLGFKNGYIIIFKGDTFAAKEWFKEHGARYTRWWGWSFSSEMDLPSDIPAGIEPIRLNWDLVGADDENLKNEDAVKAAVEGLTYDTDDSEYQGNIGDRIEKMLTIEKVVKLDGYYGESTMHIFRDDEGNAYVWTTASQSWAEGDTKLVRGTIKDHRTYKNVKQTILTRCKDMSK